MKPAIRINGLSKRYRLGSSVRAPHHTLAETIGNSVRSLFRKRSAEETQPSDFWALTDVSFDVQPGEVVGIVGRNGAGKSTLLKVLSRIVEPTAGRVEVRGRMGSLLEVGTGFHPELSGRENIFLNGSILGMSRREIERKFDEIVAFSEIERFLDTPVKRYSSGMYVRLAFAVAAHLEPEILVVDEVLAVGDAQFQRKCLGKMRDVSSHGRTVLFVSHNMTAVKALCTRCVCLAGGKVIADGDPDSAIRRHLADLSDASAANQDLRDHPRRRPGCSTIMTGVRITDSQGQIASVLGMRGGLSIHVALATPPKPIRPVLGVVVKDRYGGAIFGNNNRVVPGYEFESLEGPSTIAIHFPQCPLMPGEYSVDLFLGNEHEDFDVIDDAIGFEIMPEDVFGSGKLPPPVSGPVWLPTTWTLTPDASHG